MVGLIVALCLLNQRGQQNEENFTKIAEPEVSRLPYKEFCRRNTIPGISRYFSVHCSLLFGVFCNRR